MSVNALLVEGIGCRLWQDIRRPQVQGNCAVPCGMQVVKQDVKILIRIVTWRVAAEFLDAPGTEYRIQHAERMRYGINDHLLSRTLRGKPHGECFDGLGRRTLLGIQCIKARQCVDPLRVQLQVDVAFAGTLDQAQGIVDEVSRTLGRSNPLCWPPKRFFAEYVAAGVRGCFQVLIVGSGRRANRHDVNRCSFQEFFYSGKGPTTDAVLFFQMICSGGGGLEGTADHGSDITAQLVKGPCDEGARALQASSGSHHGDVEGRCIHYNQVTG